MSTQENLKRGVETPRECIENTCQIREFARCSRGRTCLSQETASTTSFQYLLKQRPLQKLIPPAEIRLRTGTLDAVSGTPHGENSLNLHVPRNPSRGISTTHPSAPRLPGFSSAALTMSR